MVHRFSILGRPDSCFRKLLVLNFPRACLKNHFRNLHAPLCGRFHPNSVAVAHYGALIRAKSSTNCDAHLAESIFQACSGACLKNVVMRLLRKAFGKHVLENKEKRIF